MNKARNTFIKRFLSMAIICCVLSMSLTGLGRTTVSAKMKPTSGMDDNGNKWSYDKDSKTLIFSGTKAIGINYGVDGESAYPAWFNWQNEAKVLNVKSGITGLTEGAFCEFKELESINLPDSVTYIRDIAFYECKNLKRIQMSKNILKIGESAFEECSNLQKIAIPDKVKKIDSCAFSDCDKLTSISVPNSVSKLGSYSFYYCKSLKKVKLPENLKEIAAGLFKNCSALRCVVIPKSVEKIEGGAFMKTGIEMISIPVNVTAFTQNDVSEGIFDGSKELKKVIIKTKKLTRVDKTVFEGFNEKAVIEVPKSKLTKYRQMFYKSGLSKEVKIKAFD